LAGDEYMLVGLTIAGQPHRVARHMQAARLHNPHAAGDAQRGGSGSQRAEMGFVIPVHH
jgi:hypothetical protein